MQMAYRMSLRMPNLKAAYSRLLRHHVTQYINTLPIPMHLTSYYGTNISATRVKGRSVSNFLYNRKLTCAVDELKG